MKMRQENKVVYISEDSTEHNNPTEALMHDLSFHYNEVLRKTDLVLQTTDDLARLILIRPEILETLRLLLWYYNNPGKG
jgi:hypothetical protein